MNKKETQKSGNIEVVDYEGVDINAREFINSLDAEKLHIVVCLEGTGVSPMELEKELKKQRRKK